MPIPRPDPGLHFVGGHPGVDFPRALGRVVQRGCRQASVLISDYGFCFTVFRKKKVMTLTLLQQHNQGIGMRSIDFWI